MTSEFDFLAPDEFYVQNIRTSSALEPLGCLGDLGWYNIRFFLWVMGTQLPEGVTGRILAQQRRDENHQPVPVEFAGELFFPGNVSASFFCSFRTQNQQWANLGGTRGSLYVPDFVLPFYGSEVVFDVSHPVFLPS